MTREALEKIIEKYNIKIAMADDEKISVYNVDLLMKDNMDDTIRTNKADILAILRDRKASKRKAYEERQNKIKAIEGLAEIMEYRNAWANWHEAFEHMMENGSGVMHVSAPTTKEKDLREKYPRADAYLRAQHEADKSNYELSAIGKKALERIIDGDDYLSAIEDMDSEIEEFVKKHSWD